MAEAPTQTLILYTLYRIRYISRGLMAESPTQTFSDPSEVPCTPAASHCTRRSRRGSRRRAALPAWQTPTRGTHAPAATNGAMRGAISRGPISRGPISRGPICRGPRRRRRSCTGSDGASKTTTRQAFGSSKSRAPIGVEGTVSVGSGSREPKWHLTAVLRRSRIPARKAEYARLTSSRTVEQRGSANGWPSADGSSARKSLGRPEMICGVSSGLNGWR